MRERRILWHSLVPCQLVWFLSSSETRACSAPGVSPAGTGILPGAPTPAVSPPLCCLLESQPPTCPLPLYAGHCPGTPLTHCVCDTAPVSCALPDPGLHLPGPLPLLAAPAPIPKYLVLPVDQAPMPPPLPPR